MKAIYTIAHGKVYQINQSSQVPTILLDANSGASAKVYADAHARRVTETFSISTLDAPNSLSNREMANNMREYIKRHRITHIDTIQNRYKIYIDYSSEYNGQSLGHATLTRDILGVDALMALGVAVNDENVFRRVKSFKTDIKFTISNTLPYGIMSQGKSTFKMKIHDICIFEDFNPMPADVHQSAYSTPYGYNDFTTVDNLQNMELIYSSRAAGLEFQIINLSFVPRDVIISPDITLTNYVDIYDKATIDRLLDENCHKKYPPHPHVPDDHHYPHHMFPKKDDHRPADGSDRPRGRDGWYDYYERCASTNPHALLIVENNIPDDLYEEETMIHQWKVVKDIPDIQVGEYVLYVQGFLDKPRHPHHHDPHPYPPVPPRPWWNEGENSTDDPGTDDNGSTTDTPGTTEPTNIGDPDSGEEDPDDIIDQFNQQFIEIPIEEV